MGDSLEVVSRHRCFGGEVRFLSHASTATGTDMRFSVFLPPEAANGPVPVLTWLAGLTCTEETFMIKAGAQRAAAELGLMLVAPDTSPRGEGVPDDPEGEWDFGQGAGFYLDATAEPWRRHYRMASYVTGELQDLVFAHFPGDRSRQGLFGHSMGGHGALVLGLKHPEIWTTLSAFAPVSAPMQCPWGRKAFGHYLGPEEQAWAEWDASRLVASRGWPSDRHPILVDQGLDDAFLAEQLYPEALESACAEVGVLLNLRRHAGYDHGYYFISTFMASHLRHHAEGLGLAP
jgi:S-formylglutathione hydrolase